ncbi:MAG TPA: hypothetical protein VLI39_14240 [Sedimentisphaerales bacterium]|nr:hypothetical protein [Sedimentisphaerales bacterium]
MRNERVAARQAAYFLHAAGFKRGPAAVFRKDLLMSTKRKTTTELASARYESRDQTEMLLSRLNLRRPSDDGSALYDPTELDRLLRAEDLADIDRAAERLDLFPVPALAKRLAEEIITDLWDGWLIRAGLHEQALKTKESVSRIFRKLHRTRDARRAGAAPDWPSAVAIAEFEDALQQALAARRQPAQAKTEEARDV